jgi:1,2-phenylacetyl-CoA epoxidase PaaB subunit
LEKRSFVIQFDIWLVKSNKVLTMQAVAQPGKNEHSYFVHSFSNSLKIQHDASVNGKLTLPYMSIQVAERDGKKIWVHAKSKKETVISSAIGRAIELHDQVMPGRQYHLSRHQQKNRS